MPATTAARRYGRTRNDSEYVLTFSAELNNVALEVEAADGLGH